jgi:hypothetical protein
LYGILERSYTALVFCHILREAIWCDSLFGQDYDELTESTEDKGMTAAKAKEWQFASSKGTVMLA